MPKLLNINQEELEKEIENNGLNETQNKLIAESISGFFSDLSEDLENNLVDTWKIFKLMNQECNENDWKSRNDTRDKVRGDISEYITANLRFDFDKDILDKIDKESQRLIDFIYRHFYEISWLLNLKSIGSFSRENLPPISKAVKKHISKIINELPETEEFKSECKRKKIDPDKLKKLEIPQILNPSLPESDVSMPNSNFFLTIKQTLGKPSSIIPEPFYNLVTGILG